MVDGFVILLVTEIDVITTLGLLMVDGLMPLSFYLFSKISDLVNQCWIS
jgi:hypothetical protein